MLLHLTQQILLALQTILDVQDVAVSINAAHYCVNARGVMDGSSKTRTLALGGKFKNDPAIRKEVIS